MARAFSGLGVQTGLAADRTALTGLVAGQQFYETDTGLMYLYTGSSWQLFMPGNFNIVENSTTNYVSTQSTSYVSTGLSATISKTYSSSKILVIANCLIACWNGNANQDSYTSVRLIETNSSRTKDFFRVLRGYNSNNSIATGSRMPFQWIDTVSGTGSRTYRVDFACTEGAPDTSEFNFYTNGIARSDIFLQEVF